MGARIGFCDVVVTKVIELIVVSRIPGITAAGRWV